MRLLLQRVHWAAVNIQDRRIQEIQRGLLVFVGIEKSDTETHADVLAEKLAHYLVFDHGGKGFQRNVIDIQGEILAVPQFTLAANTQKGLKPDLAAAAKSSVAAPLFAHFITALTQYTPRVKSGIFGAHMQVHIINDGPVTLSLQK